MLAVADQGQVVKGFDRADTGERINGARTPSATIAAAERKAKHRAFPRDWAALFLIRFDDLVPDGITMRDLRVFGKLLRHMRFRNIIDIPQSVIAEETGIGRPHVSESIGRLLQAEILQKIANHEAPSRPLLRVNPALLFKGSEDERQLALRVRVIEYSTPRHRSSGGLYGY